MNYLSQQTDPVTGKPIIDPKALQTYMQHSSRQRAFVAGGVQAGMTLANALQHAGYANQEIQARTGLYNAQTTKALAPAVPSPVEAGRQARFQAKQDATALNAKIKLAQNQQKDAGTQLEDLGYAGDPGSLLDSSVHKGGVMSGKQFVPTDPNDPNKPQTHIQVGGGASFDMPTFKRLQGIAQRHQQLQGIINTGLQQQAGGGGGAAAGTGGLTTVNTPDEARALPPGTKYRAASWPAGRYAVIPGTPAATTTAAPANGADDTTGDNTDDEE
jgi:hypothetical protein